MHRETYKAFKRKEWPNSLTKDFIHLPPWEVAV